MSANQQILLGVLCWIAIAVASREVSFSIRGYGREFMLAFGTLLPLWMLPWMIVSWIATAVMRGGDTPLMAFTFFGPIAFLSIAAALATEKVMLILVLVAHVAGLFILASLKLRGERFPELCGVQTLVLAIVTAIFAHRVRKQRARKPDGLCTSCGYPIRGIRGNRCPECGAGVTRPPQSWL